MLVLKRYSQEHREHSDEDSIRIECPNGEVIIVTLMKAGNGWGRIGIEASKGFVIHRQECFDKMQQRYAESVANSEAATEDLGSAPGAYREGERA